MASDPAYFLEMGPSGHGWALRCAFPWPVCETLDLEEKRVMATAAPATVSKPQLRAVSFSDLVDAIAAGIRDFRAAPIFGLMFAALYVAAGWLLVALLWSFGMPHFAYPLAMGFALIAPFAATGFYAVSEHLERGKPMTWSAILGSMRAASRRDVRWMALITGFALVIWMDIAAFLLFAFTSFQSISADTLRELLATPIGWLFAGARQSRGRDHCLRGVLDFGDFVPDAL